MMKKILLIMATMVLVAGANAASKNEIKQNYKMCLDFTGEIDPKHPQINFDECDKWIDMYEHPKKYAEQNARLPKGPVKLDGKIYKIDTEKFEYLKYYNKVISYDVKDEFGNISKKKKNKAVYLLEQKLAKLNKEEKMKERIKFIAEAIVLSLNNGDIGGYKDKSSADSQIKNAERKATIEREIYLGFLPTTININTQSVSSKRSAISVSLDTYGLSAKVMDYFAAGNLKTAIDRTILSQAFFISHNYMPYDLPRVYGDLALQALYDLSKNGDDDATKVILLMAKGDSNKVSRFMMQSKNTKYYYNRIHEEVYRLIK